MKRLRNLFLLFLLCMVGVIYTIVRPSVAAAQSEQTQPALHANAKTLEQHVRKLSEDFIPRDHLHPENLNKTVDYIAEQWRDVGLTTTEQHFQVNGITYKNVITRIGGSQNSNTNNSDKHSDSNTIVIGAHYDAAGELPAADDNASGVAGLIEVARILQQAHTQKPFKHPIELVAYSLEEPPYFATEYMGSYIHAAQAKKQNMSIKYMLSLEMLGYFSDEPNSQQFPTPLLKPFYPDTGNFIAVVGQLKPFQTSLSKRVKNGMSVHTDLPVYSMDAPSALEGIDFSDHRNYWAHGYPAAMITDTAFFRNTNYHTPEDTADKLDYMKMAKVIDGLAGFIISEQS